MSLLSEFSGHPTRFERCGLETRLSAAELRTVTVMVTVTEPRSVRVSYHDPSSLPGATSLLRCIRAEVARVVRTYRVSSIVFMTEAFLMEPFAVLDLPMEPPPLPATRALTPAEVDALLVQLGAALDDVTRLAQLTALETTQVAIPSTAARPLLATFEQPDALVGGYVCRVLTGRGALQAVQAGLPASERARVRGLTRGTCGVEVMTHRAQRDRGTY